MGTSYNPKIITSNLVALFDPASIKSYPASQYSYVNNISLMLDFDGRVSSVQIYNRVLTSTEVYNNFVANRGRFGV